MGSIPKKKPAVFKVTVCFVSYSRIDADVIENINTGLNFEDEYRFVLKSKEMQAVSIVIGLLVPGAVVPASRGTVINDQYTKAFEEGGRMESRQKKTGVDRRQHRAGGR